MAPLELGLELQPRSRFDVIDVLNDSHCASRLRAFPHALYASCHTTAGFLEQSVVTRLEGRHGGIRPYMDVFQRMFPQGAGYRHDELHLRSELSSDQRDVEPRNADAHLAFIAAGLRTCVRYVNRPDRAVYFVDLDGVNGGQPRRRFARVVGFNGEEIVARERLHVPVSSHPLDSISLRDPRIGLYARINELIDRHRITKGRLRLTLGPGEDHAALTINEYETLLMRHDIADIIRDPLRFMAEKGRHLWADPYAIPAKTMDYAKYDCVRLFNRLFDAFQLSESFLETLLVRVIALPARRFLRMKRSASLLVSDRESPGKGTIVEGRYQCPVLLQWGRAHGGRRVITFTLSRLY